MYDGVTLLDVTGPVEVLHRSGQYETVLVSAHGGQVRTASGVMLAGAVTTAESIDTVVVPGADHLVDGVPEDVLRVTATLAEKAERVASVCSGAFVLAELGMLDGRRA
ncbi:MAG TPA: DJ-1/PfpI family protein, partial [Kribbella sp.]|nr:DJ-1/PfpI family protein [Kribbella sp.]